MKSMFFVVAVCWSFAALNSVARAKDGEPVVLIACSTPGISPYPGSGPLVAERPGHRGSADDGGREDFRPRLDAFPVRTGPRLVATPTGSPAVTWCHARIFGVATRAGVGFPDEFTSVTTYRPVVTMDWENAAASDTRSRSGKAAD